MSYRRRGRGREGQRRRRRGAAEGEGEGGGRAGRAAAEAAARAPEPHAAHDDAHGGRGDLAERSGRRRDVRARRAPPASQEAARRVRVQYEYTPFDLLHTELCIQFDSGSDSDSIVREVEASRSI